MTTTDLRGRTAVAPTSRTARGSLRRCLGYGWASTRQALTDASFIGFLLVMPTAIYLFFATVYGTEAEGGIEAKRQIMINMATYGAMGSALVAGSNIQIERATGWLRQLQLTALTATQFFVVRAVVALLLVLPPVLLVLLVGRLDGVQLAAWQWFAVAGLSLVVLIPFVVMGIVVGLWLKPQAASGATTFLMLAMAMLGGLWVPMQFLPDILQTIGRTLPSYWAMEIAKLPLSGGAVPLRGVVLLAAWTVALTALGAIGYRRAIHTSKR